ncbi:MAG: hypothetical protein ACR2PA_05425 [Hyphomicrobiaceae bacterium]
MQLLLQTTLTTGSNTSVHDASIFGTTLSRLSTLFQTWLPTTAGGGRHAEFAGLGN